LSTLDSRLFPFFSSVWFSLSHTSCPRFAYTELF
jgi:hypothetical protein